MVLSCLVEPLVLPLTERGTSGRRQSALTGTRLLATALACASVLALAGEAGEAKVKDVERARVAQKIAFESRNAHKKPDPTPYRELLATVFARRDDLIIVSLAEAPSFEQAALEAHRTRDKRKLVPIEGPNLGLGQRIHRLYGGTSSTFLRFGAAVHRSGIPTLS